MSLTILQSCSICNGCHATSAPCAPVIYRGWTVTTTGHSEASRCHHATNPRGNRISAISRAQLKRVIDLYIDAPFGRMQAAV